MNKKRAFNNYLRNLCKIALLGDAREESFYPPLAEMLAEVARATGRQHIHVTTLPRSTDAGNPDFRLWNGADRIVGYIEAKKPTEERLDLIEDSEQLRRYRETFPNLILTNFLEFRLYRNGERIDSVLAARPYILNRARQTPPIEKPDELYALLERFFDFSLPPAFTAESLAVALAKRTRFLRDIVAQQLAAEQATPGDLTGFYEAFQQFLIGHLTPEDFADLYAQTIAYGLFAARTRAGDDFSRRAAFDSIPHTIGVLRDLFRFISLGDLPGELAWCVDDIAEVLAVADVPGILDAYYKDGKGSDPIVHFYETFLAQYDPEERERRGVYYTPEPVVGYIVRSLHGILKSEFGLADGLASDGVTLLDPAAGTMTFVARATQEAVAEFETKYGTGSREDFIRGHVLKNFYAFELMMAPYAVGHLKMGFFLEELGHRLADNERVRFYLTNTLDTEELDQSKLPGLSSLAEESNLAGKVKKETRILVILGNPPYSGHSSNVGDWIQGLIDDYKQVDGQPLGEKNPKWLQDDYVKFLRFAQWKIDKAGRGVVGMITNHSYLDNPTFRGMRQSLLKTFDDIYVLDLHGNSLKKETCPDGSKDENVFDIRQGVAIAFFVKRGPSSGTAAVSAAGSEASRLRQEGQAGCLPASRQDAGDTTIGDAGDTGGDAAVHHADLWGLRDAKYAWLEAHDREQTDWRELQPASPFYLFVPRDNALAETYEGFFSIPALFPVNSVGIVTARDSLTIHWSPEELWKTVTVFAHMGPELAREAYNLGRDAQDWEVPLAQKDIVDSGPTRDNMVKVLYRPFDIRYTYYTGRSRGFICRPRPEVMRHMLAGENVGLMSCRQLSSARLPWAHAMVTDALAECCVVSNRTREIGYVLPLYLYPTADQADLFAHHNPSERKPNLNPAVVAALEAALGMRYTPPLNAATIPRPDGTAAVPAAGSEASRLRQEGQAGCLPASRQDAGDTAALRYGSVIIRDRGRLPHWETDDATYFVTFRLADSLPAGVVAELAEERELLKRQATERDGRLTAEERTRIRALGVAHVDRFLDSGVGACHLSDPRVAQMVWDALRHFDGRHYRLLAWCLMPNHVHVVFRLCGGSTLSKVLHSWKSFTAKEANRVLGREGAFWQREYYDHIVRNAEECVRIVDYVVSNPERAGLTDWPWVGWEGSAAPLSDGTAAVPAAGSEASRLRQEGQAGCLPASRQDAGDTTRGDAGGTTVGDGAGTRAIGTFGPEDIFHYVYAVLYAPTYRAKYAEFLRMDFPRVPFTSDAGLFSQLAALGARLVGLHLLKSPELDPPACRFDGEGDSRIARGTKAGLRYEPGEERVYINATQYFAPVPREVWEYQVGGYQVCHKWLKDRKERALSADEVRTYCRIVTALKLTLDIQEEIDTLYPRAEAETVALSQS